ncbi:MAG: NAD(P)/FAD-dependent oxidoreductase [Pseudomonadota bacterium]
MTPTMTTDVIIIGAGPVGLFAVFELGLLGLRAHLIDILPRAGGQCAELYPEKPIYDIPAIPSCTGQELVDRLLQQIKPFAPTFHLGRSAQGLARTADDTAWQVTLDDGTILTGAAVVIAAGGGQFEPKKLPGAQAFEGKGVAYAVRETQAYRDRDVVIAGGGDSALDWVLALAPVARSVALVHRRDAFRGAPASEAAVRALVAKGQVALLIGQITDYHGDEAGHLARISLRLTGQGDEATITQEVSCQALLAFYGLTMRLGPLADFGLALERQLVVVDTARFETSLPGVFAIGDINTYPGKLKLILSGFHEAALMAHAAFGVCRPDERLRFGYTTTSSDLKARLGVHD